MEQFNSIKKLLTYYYVILFLLRDGNFLHLDHCSHSFNQLLQVLLNVDKINVNHSMT